MNLIFICLVLQFVFNMEQGLPLLPEWLSFNRTNVRARKGVEIGPARFLLRYGIYVPCQKQERCVFAVKENRWSNLFFLFIGYRW